ncbi:hypothetical protein SNEBB_002009 [Seison nebaliae]|nr:hypothetical protein SNEBB_002009 [Seison nebaliae]
MNGTGRKNNKWLSNDGAIILTFLHKLSTNSIYQKSLINLQYAAALAVLEMIMDLFDELEIDEKIVMQIKNCIKIKWPNDIYYVEKNVDKNVYKKLGGILIRTSCTPQMNSNQYQFVINMGIGINFRNECLVETGIGLETIFKKFNVSLKDHWNEFYIYHLLFSKWQKWLNITNVKFLQESLVNNWMHRDEVFSLKKYSNESFQLIGIDEDGNLLAKMMTGEKSLIRLSSDENSLDVNESIIKPK